MTVRVPSPPCPPVSTDLSFRCREATCSRAVLSVGCHSLLVHPEMPSPPTITGCPTRWELLEHESNPPALMLMSCIRSPQKRPWN